MVQTIFVEKIKTHILRSITFIFFFENRAVYEKMGKKYCTAGQDTDENTAQVHCMLDT